MTTRNRAQGDQSTYGCQLSVWYCSNVALSCMSTMPQALTSFGLLPCPDQQVAPRG